jgi:opacity protein-like surface antigen
MLKGTIPFGACFGGYVKAGAAYVQNKLNINASTSTATVGGVVTNTISGEDTTNKIKPIAAAGLTYDINENVVVDLSYTYLFGSSSSSSDNNVFQNINNDSSNVPRASLVALGITYYFGGFGADDT